jgi:hypothetical protein
MSFHLKASSFFFGKSQPLYFFYFLIIFTFPCGFCTNTFIWCAEEQNGILPQFVHSMERSVIIRIIALSGDRAVPLKSNIRTVETLVLTVAQETAINPITLQCQVEILEF